MIRIYSYDKIYVVIKSSSFPCCVSSVSGIKTYLHPILKSIKRVLQNCRFRSITINSVVKSPFRCLVIHLIDHCLPPILTIFHYFYTHEKT